MSRRRVQRFPYQLDAGGVKHLGAEEIVAILRGADDMIGRGGRTQLSKLLKGSREASVLAHGLSGNPSYGFYCDLAPGEILGRIDWTIEHEYLGIVYDHRLPVLVFTKRGWAIEVVTIAAELLQGLDARLAAGPPYDLSHIRDRNRQIILLLLDKVEASRRGEFIPLLLAWSEIDCKKVRARIGKVVRALEEEKV